MRPFRSHVKAAIVIALLLLGLVGGIAQATDLVVSDSVPEDPPPSLTN